MSPVQVMVYVRYEIIPQGKIQPSAWLTEPHLLTSTFSSFCSCQRTLWACPKLYCFLYPPDSAPAVYFAWNLLPLFFLCGFYWSFGIQRGLFPPWSLPWFLPTWTRNLPSPSSSMPGLWWGSLKICLINYWMSIYHNSAEPLNKHKSVFLQL